MLGHDDAVTVETRASVTVSGGGGKQFSNGFVLKIHPLGTATLKLP